MVRGRLAAVIVFAGVIAGFASFSQAQTAESFYKGKTLKLLVASGSGGGYDTYTRVLGRHIGRHVPGQPNIVVQNMPGASGLKATNYIANNAPKDGTEILATYNAILIEPLVGGNAVQFDVLGLTMIGSISKVQNLCVMWNTSSVKRIEDAMEREVVLAATGDTGNAATLPRLLNLIVGTKFKVVKGYSTSESRLAVERGEAEGICGYSYGTLVASSPDWILNKKVNILIQNGMTPHPKIPDVPLTYSKIKTDDGKAMFRLYTASEEIGRPYVAPPDLPAERTEALRRALDATLRDKDFLTDAEKTNLEVDPLTGEEMYSLLRDVYATDPKVVEQVRDLVNRND